MEGGKGGHFEVIEAGSTSCFSLPPFLTISPQLLVCEQNMIGQAHIPAGFSSPPWGPECPLELRIKIKLCSPELYSIRTTGKSLTYMGPQDWTLVLALASQTSGCLSVSPVSYLNCQWVKSCSSVVNRTDYWFRLGKPHCILTWFFQRENARRQFEKQVIKLIKGRMN